MADQKDDIGFSLPAMWEDARPYLEMKMSERDAQWDVRVSAIENEIGVLGNRLDCRFDKLDARHVETHGMQQRQAQQLTHFSETLEGMRAGMGEINEKFTNTHDMLAAQIAFQNQQTREGFERWTEYDKVQVEIDANVKKGVAIISREDKHRTLWRILILIAAYAAIFALVFEKV